MRIAADNAIHGWWLRGEPVTDWQGHDLAASAVSVTRNGELVTTGSGAAVLGHPLNVMAWLADELPRFGLRLRRGDVVTTGVATDVFEANAGDSCVADFGPFGTGHRGVRLTTAVLAGYEAAAFTSATTCFSTAGVHAVSA